MENHMVNYLAGFCGKNSVTNKLLQLITRKFPLNLLPEKEFIRILRIPLKNRTTSRLYLKSLARKIWMYLRSFFQKDILVEIEKYFGIPEEAAPVMLPQLINACKRARVTLKARSPSVTSLLDKETKRLYKIIYAGGFESLKFLAKGSFGRIYQAAYPNLEMEENQTMKKDGTPSISFIPTNRKRGKNYLTVKTASIPLAIDPALRSSNGFGDISSLWAEYSLFYEYQIAQQLNHPNILSIPIFLYGWPINIPRSLTTTFRPGRTKSLDKAFLTDFSEKEKLDLKVQAIIYPFLDIDLLDYLQTYSRPSIDTCLLWMHELLSGLAHMHKHQIVHWDLKVENIFLKKDGSVLIGDLGLAMDLTVTTEWHTNGTPLYRPPDCSIYGLVDRNDSREIHPYARDIWSLGLVFYELLTTNILDDEDDKNLEPRERYWEWLWENIATKEQKNLRHRQANNWITRRDHVREKVYHHQDPITTDAPVHKEPRDLVEIPAADAQSLAQSAILKRSSSKMPKPNIPDEESSIYFQNIVQHSTKELAHFVMSMLNFYPSQRPTAEHLLKHPIFHKRK
jgi:serine/threonine protein kinase